MRLYLIRRVSDAKFLRKIEGHYSAHTGQDKNCWSDIPAYMLRTPDGVAANLRKLCSTPYYEGDYVNYGRELQWKDFDANKMGDLEIVCMNVDIVSMIATPAKEFIQIDAVENYPLTRLERQGH